MVTVGLFGTCGRSQWREPFIAALSERSIAFFNPQLPPGAWTPGAVADENKHLAEDDIVLFPVTAESSGLGSLGEIGFSIRAALRANRFRQFIFLIEDTCTDPEATPEVVKESNRMRALVKSKLADEARDWHNIHLVDTLEEMLEMTLRLAPAMAEINAADVKRA